MTPVYDGTCITSATVVRLPPSTRVLTNERDSGHGGVWLYLGLINLHRTGHSEATGGQGGQLESGQCWTSVGTLGLWRARTTVFGNVCSTSETSLCEPFCTFFTRLIELSRFGFQISFSRQGLLKSALAPEINSVKFEKT